MGKKFLPNVSEESGSASVVTAVVFLVLCGSVGAAVDFGMAWRARSYLQADLDAAVLAVAAGRQSAESEQGSAQFAGRGHSGIYEGPPPTFSVQADGTVEAAANMKIKTALLPLFGIKELPVVAHAKAIAKSTNASKHTLVSAAVKGWFAKEVYGVVRDSSGNVVGETKLFSYDYDYATNTRTVEPPLGVASPDIKLEAGLSFALKMRVWPNYPLSGSSRDTVAPIDYYSDDPNARLHRSGSCAGGELFQWEDAPNDLDPSQDDYTDFVFTMQCKSVPGSVTAVRLTE